MLSTGTGIPLVGGGIGNEVIIPGSLEAADSVDRYGIDLNAGEVLRVELTGPRTEAIQGGQVRLLADNGHELVQQLPSTFFPQSTGRFTVEVTSTQSPGDYELSVLRTLDIGNPRTTTLVHRYSFNGTGTNGAPIVDSISGADGVLREADDSRLEGGQVVLGGGASSTAGYVDLPNGIVSALRGNNATFEMWVTWQNSGSSFPRLFDFRETIHGEILNVGGVFESNARESLFLGRGALSSPPLFVGDVIGGNLRATNFTDPLSAGAEHHVVVTVSGNDGMTVNVYVDGQLMLAPADSTQSYTLQQLLIGLNDVNNWLGRSLNSLDDNLDGSFNEFRVYDGALTERGILSSLASGPDRTFATSEVFDPSEVILPSVLVGSTVDLAAGPGDPALVRLKVTERDRMRIDVDIEGGDGKISVFDDSGRVLLTRTSTDGQATIETELPIGFFGIRISVNEGASAAQLIISPRTTDFEGGPFEERRGVISVGDNPVLQLIGDFNRDRRVDLVTANRDSDNLSILLGRSDGSFEQSRQVPIGGQPRSLRSGDFNGDGRPDLAAVISDDNVSVLLGRGDGSFLDASQSFVGEAPLVQLTGDFNGDGLSDLATVLTKADRQAAYSNSDVSILLGRTDGSFEAPGGSQGAIPPSGLRDRSRGEFLARTDDFNGDGRLDLVIGNGNNVEPFPNQVSLLLGRGDGSFEAANMFSVGSVPHVLLSDDLNDDGQIDLAVVNRDSASVSVLLGAENSDGSFTFMSASQFSVDELPAAVLSGDFDGDGRLDIATTNTNRNNLSVLLGDKDGPSLFLPVTNSGFVGQSPEGLVGGDFNGDGRLDFATANRDSNDVSILLRREDGSFAIKRIGVGQLPTALLSDDFNGDGRPDLATANRATDDVTVLLGRGDGSFAEPEFSIRFRNQIIVRTSATTANQQLISVNGNGEILVRDFLTDSTLSSPNVLALSDGIVAAAISSEGDKSVNSGVTSDSVIILTNELDSRNANTSDREFALSGVLPRRLESADLDRDGFADFVTANASSNDVSVLFRDSSETAVEIRLQGGNGPTDIQIVDVNNDNFPEIVVANQLSGDVSVFRNLGDRRFDEIRVPTGDRPTVISVVSGEPNVNSTLFPETLAVSDVNQDGLMDIVVGNTGPNTLSILTGTGDGRFELAPDLTVPLIGESLVEIAVGQFNSLEDSYVDLILLNDSNVLTVYEGARTGRFTRSEVEVATGSPGTALTITDLDRDGFDDVLVGNEFGDIQTLFGNGDGTFADFRRAEQRVPLVVADLDGDGKTEVVLANQSQDRLVVLDAASQNVTEEVDDGLLAPGAVELIDLNADSKPELVVANTQGTTVSVFVMTDGSFGDPAQFFTGTGPAGITVGDVDTDGRPDLIVSNQSSNDVTVLLNRSSRGGEIRFDLGPRLDVGAGPVSTALSDLNEDGTLDLVVTNAGEGTLSMLSGIGGGFFNDAAATTIPFGQTSQQGGVLVGNSFVATSPLTNSILFVRNLADAFRGFGGVQTFGTGGRSPSFLTAFNFTGGGLFDLAVANTGDGTIGLLEGLLDGFSVAGLLTDPNLSNPSSLEFAQVDGILQLFATDEGEETATVFDFSEIEEALADNLPGPESEDSPEDEPGTESGIAIGSIRTQLLFAFLSVTPEFADDEDQAGGFLWIQRFSEFVTSYFRCDSGGTSLACGLDALDEDSPTGSVLRGIIPPLFVSPIMFPPFIGPALDILLDRLRELVPPDETSGEADEASQAGDDDGSRTTEDAARDGTETTPAQGGSDAEGDEESECPDAADDTERAALYDFMIDIAGDQTVTAALFDQGVTLETTVRKQSRSRDTTSL